MKKFLLFFLMISFLSAHQYVVKEGEVYKGDLIAYKTNALVGGVVTGNVIVLKGNVEIRGKVEKDVIVILGSLNLGPKAEVKGDAVVLGGEVHKEKGAEVAGEIVRLSLNLKNEIGWTRISLIKNITSFLLWLVFAIFLLYVFPRNLQFASAYIEENFWKTMGYGFALLIATGVLMVIFSLLSLLVVGIPFLLLLVFWILAAALFGKVSFFLFLGKILLKNRSYYLQALMGLLVYAVFLFVPFLSALVRFFSVIFAFGVVYLTRFGTKI